ncbi:MAG TPA: response regulator transcription factor [bacterium]|nr:response regulator transcription factor [bacterium]
MPVIPDERKTVFLVEDDPSIVHSLGRYLETSGYRIMATGRGDEALRSYREHSPDIIILDINLPGKNGFDVCSEIRNESNVPIIILSAREGESDKVRALDQGADDYIAKPFSPRELLARIQAVLKRTMPRSTPVTTPMSSGLILDPDNFSITLHGEAVRATKTEFQLLSYLMERRGKIVAREDLMRDIMGYDNYLYDRTIDTHVKNLRKKL